MVRLPRVSGRDAVRAFATPADLEERSSLGEGFSSGEGNPLDAGGSKEGLGQTLHASRIVSLEGPGVPVPATEVVLSGLGHGSFQVRLATILGTGQTQRHEIDLDGQSDHMLGLDLR